MELVIAIDPGATGAIALIDTIARRHEAVDMPIAVDNRTSARNKSKKSHAGRKKKKSHAGRKKKKPAALVDGRALAHMLRGIDTKQAVVVIEKVGAMPGQGVTSMFNFGNSAGVVRGVAEALDFKVVFVTPQVWKRHHGLIGTVKDASRILALKKFPKLALTLKRKRDGGRADAILIADWYASTVH